MLKKGDKVTLSKKWNKHANGEIHILARDEFYLDDDGGFPMVVIECSCDWIDKEYVTKVNSNETIKKEDEKMQKLESVKISIEEYEKFTNKELTNNEKELFSYAYGRGFVDSGVLITDLLTKQ